MAPDTCPNCGADVPSGSRACPECGADEETGWSDSASADRLGIPQENFDYQHFVKEEFGSPRAKPRGLGWIWWVTALLLIVLFLLFYFR